MKLRHRNRDTVDGRFVTAAQAAANPATTVTETVPAPSPVIAAAAELCKQLRMNGDLDRIRPVTLTAYDDLMVELNK